MSKSPFILVDHRDLFVFCKRLKGDFVRIVCHVKDYLCEPPIFPEPTPRHATPRTTCVPPGRYVLPLAARSARVAPRLRAFSSSHLARARRRQRTVARTARCTAPSKRQCTTNSKRRRHAVCICFPRDAMRGAVDDTEAGGSGDAPGMTDGGIRNKAETEFFF